MKRIAICRATGLFGWVAECQYEDGRNLLDLDIQAMDLPQCYELAKQEYPDVDIYIDASNFWKNSYREWIDKNRIAEQ